jgi:hypothetical protein
MLYSQVFIYISVLESFQCHAYEISAQKAPSVSDSGASEALAVKPSTLKDPFPTILQFVVNFLLTNSCSSLYHHHMTIKDGVSS